ncbi:uncharacterized protein LOC113928670 [Zalophus californianus]|uniref:Uncharacterized protein LOC113928670 n=1 Tax=Zalophus californianus TaxID=9704 RepID=A0A6J2DV18_ZALCA|nr:uncharacterized protein LOC113928670 [Zalophus californianus]
MQGTQLVEELGSARGCGAYSNAARCCCDSQGLGLHMEPVCVLRPPCDSGSCLLAGASIPAQLDLGGTTLPGLGRRASKTTKKPKMNRQYDQPKTGGSSTPARRLLLLPSLEAL